MKITWDKDAEKFTWKNCANVEWTMKPVQESGQWSTTKLAVNSTYYRDNKVAGLETVKGKTIISWLDEPYTKDADACPPKACL